MKLAWGRCAAVRMDLSSVGCRQLVFSGRWSSVTSLKDPAAYGQSAELRATADGGPAGGLYRPGDGGGGGLPR